MPTRLNQPRFMPYERPRTGARERPEAAPYDSRPGRSFAFSQETPMVVDPDPVFRGFADPARGQVEADKSGADDTAAMGTIQNGEVGEKDKQIKLFEKMPSLPGQQRSKDEYILVDKNFHARVNGKLDRPLNTRAYNNDLCRLYRDSLGNYYPSPLAYNRIEIPRHIPKQDRAKYRNEVWERAHFDMGIPGRIRAYWDRDERIKAHKIFGLKPEDRYIKTDGGFREVKKRYKFPFQAGATLPDIMIKTPENDIHFIWRHPGDKYKGRTFKEFEAEIKKDYGATTEIKLKSKSGIMHDSSYLESWEKGGADIRFGEFAGETRPQNAKLPHGIINMGRIDTGDGKYSADHYVSIKFLMKYAANSEWAKALRMGKLSDRIRILARDGNQYMSPSSLNYSDRSHFEQSARELGLPPEIGFQSYSPRIKRELNEMMSPVLVALGPELKEPRDVTPEELKDLESKPPFEKHLLIANRNRDGHRTGNYTSAAEYQRKQQELPPDAASVLGYDPDKYSANFTAPGKANRAIAYEPRVRGQAAAAMDVTS